MRLVFTAERFSLAVLLSLASACFQGPGFLQQKSSAMLTSAAQTSVAAVTTSASNNGMEVASISADAKVTQEIRVSAASPVSGTVVSFPPGALAISTQVMIGEAVSMATVGMTSQLGLGDNNITGSGVSVLIQPAVRTDAAEPFTISLPLPVSSSLSLVDPFANLVVIYKIAVESEGKYMAGILPRAELEIAGNTATFKTKYFGAFQTAYTTTPVTEKKEAQVNSPVLAKHESMSLPSLSIVSRSRFVVGSRDTVEIRGSNFRPTMVLALAGRHISDVKVLSDVSASFVTPSYDGFGLANLTVEQDGVTQTISLFYTGSKTDYPLITKAPNEVCSGEKYYGSDGVLTTGTKVCTSSVVQQPSPNACLQDGEVGCVTTNSFKAVDTRVLNAANIKSGVTIAGVAGTYTAASFPDCTAALATNCVANNTYKAVETAQLSAGNIKAGVTIGGVSGQYPSSLFPLNGNTSLSDLPNFTQLTTDGTYEYWNSAGEYFTGAIGSQTVTPQASPIAVNLPGTLLRLVTVNAGSVLPNCTGDGSTGCTANSPYVAALTTGLATKVLSGQTVAGVSGAVLLPNAADIRSGVPFGAGGLYGTLAAAPAACSSDGQDNCVATATYKAANTGSFGAWDIRAGKTVAGVPGKLDFYKNAANLTNYDRQDTGSVIGFDPFDTIDDFNNNIATLPQDKAPTWSLPGDNWVRDSQSDTGVVNQICDGGEACIYQDKATGIIWARADSTGMTWDDAITYCQNHNYGGYLGWRLPTQKELQQAYINGITALRDANKLDIPSSTSFVSATTYSQDVTKVWYTTFNGGGMATSYKSINTYGVICVRPEI